MVIYAADGRGLALVKNSYGPHESARPLLYGDLPLRRCRESGVVFTPET